MRTVIFRLDTINSMRIKFWVETEGVRFLVEKFLNLNGAVTYSDFSGDQMLLYKEKHGTNHTPLMEEIQTRVNAYLDGLMKQEHKFNYTEKTEA